MMQDLGLVFAVFAVGGCLYALAAARLALRFGRDVPVDIAMANTELAPQFRRLGNVVDRLVYPAKDLLGMPDVNKPAPPIVPK